MNRKNNKITIFTIIAILITMIAMIATSGTYAKYTSRMDFGDAEGVIAKWKIMARGNGLEAVDLTNATNKPITFDLFSTIKDEDGTDETDVLQYANKAARLAPGTKGSFEFQLINISEVNAKYSIIIEDANDAMTNKVPIKFSVDGDNYYSIEELAGQLSGNIDMKKATDVSNNDNWTNVTIDWVWPYEETVQDEYGEDVIDANKDCEDTDVGKDAAKSTDPYTYTLKAYVVVDQVN